MFDLNPVNKYKEVWLFCLQTPFSFIGVNRLLGSFDFGPIMDAEQSSISEEEVERWLAE